ncbi:MAG: ACP S-malonyltransferase, partial [Deltaproteobacteria bacterium]|nr:ACP S-malonyltransferase [Deltaproteobacteria bacterium]
WTKMSIESRINVLRRRNLNATFKLISAKEDSEMSACGVVFPGQGSQVTGMGQDFFQSYAESREIFARASEAIDIDMTRLCFSTNELLDRTEYTQPAILTAEMAMYAALRNHYSIDGAFFGGHSLGEYTALVAADVLRFEDALKIVKKRGFLMQCAVREGRGAMAAIILEDLAAVDFETAIAESGAEVANFNSKDQIVISGMTESVSEACEKLSSLYPEIRIVPLAVSAPFHSSHMRSIRRSFQKYLQPFQRNIDRTNIHRVLSNYTGTFHSVLSLIPSLVKQVAAPVRWVENMHAIAAEADEIYEIGPQRVLSRFFSSIGIQVKAVTDGRSVERVFGGAHAHGI